MKRERIYLSPPELTGVENQYIEDILLSNWIAPVGPHLSHFEEKISGFTGFKYALAVNSGTSAIHLALLCHDVKKVILFCPALLLSAELLILYYI